MTGLPHDVELTMQIFAVILLQGVNIWRSMANGRGIKGTRNELTGLSAVTTDIQKQMHIARQALAKIDTLMAATKPYSGGRRASDAPSPLASGEPTPPKTPYEGPPRRNSDGGSGPRDAGPPRGTWPLGGG